MEVDGDGNSFLLLDNSRGPQVVKVTPKGSASVVVGNGIADVPVPGPAAASPLQSITSHALGAAGNLYLMPIVTSW